jgi:hypothetical protein
MLVSFSANKVAEPTQNGAPTSGLGGVDIWCSDCVLAAQMPIAVQRLNRGSTEASEGAVDASNWIPARLVACGTIYRSCIETIEYIVRARDALVVLSNVDRESRAGDFYQYILLAQT